mmetsp:Transcript_168144/g.540100  ORF Transcript_168144/g.540100 Transcript_168144/m.540100 type:complete len:355 (+) Transcript_168144:552-1616(+)
MRCSSAVARNRPEPQSRIRSDAAHPPAAIIGAFPRHRPPFRPAAAAAPSACSQSAARPPLRRRCRRHLPTPGWPRRCVPACRPKSAWKAAQSTSSTVWPQLQLQGRRRRKRWAADLPDVPAKISSFATDSHHRMPHILPTSARCPSHIFQQHRHNPPKPTPPPQRPPQQPRPSPAPPPRMRRETRAMPLQKEQRWQPRPPQRPTSVAPSAAIWPPAASARSRHAPERRADACGSRGGSPRHTSGRRSPNRRSRAEKPSRAPHQRKDPPSRDRTAPPAGPPRRRRRGPRPRTERWPARRPSSQHSRPCRQSSGSRRRPRTPARRRRSDAFRCAAGLGPARRARSPPAACSSRGSL